MNIFGFRPFKGRFNLGDSDDIPTNDDGTLIGALKRKIGTESGTVGTYTTQTVEKISYDNTNKQLILKVNGADTPVPFSGKFTMQQIKGNGAYNGSFTLDHDTNAIYVGQSWKGTFQLYVNGTARTITDICNYGPSSGSQYGLHIGVANGTWKKGDVVGAHSLGAASEYGIWIMA